MGSGTLYQWFNRNFYHNGTDNKDTTQINREVAAQPPGCDGLICFADFAGRGCPNTDPHARGIFANVGLQHTRGSFARSILEGICFDICRCIRHIRGLGIPVHDIQSTGGLTNFPVFNQILADMSEMEICVSSNAEATATGAFLIACDTLGLSCTRNLQPCSRYIPDPSAREKYRVLAAYRENLDR